MESDISYLYCDTVLGIIDKILWFGVIKRDNYVECGDIFFIIILLDWILLI